MGTRNGRDDGQALEPASLAELRQSLSLTQLELARRTGISFQTISEIENGRKPRPSTIRKLADAMSQPIDLIARLAGVALPADTDGDGRGRGSAPALAPMGLAILGLLRDQAMHPYEMVSRMRDRHVDMYIKVNFGAVYYHIDQLLSRRLIEVRDIERDGNRPERTIYGITPDGHDVLERELIDSMSSMTRHYDPVDAGLHLAHLLDPALIRAALLQRQAHLRRMGDQLTSNTRSAWDHLTVSQLHILRRHQAWIAAETEWLDGYIRDVDLGLAGRKVTDVMTSEAEPPG